MLTVRPRQKRHRLQHRKRSPTGKTNWNLKNASPRARPARSSQPWSSAQRVTIKHSNDRNESWPSARTKYSGRNNIRKPAQIVAKGTRGNIERRSQVQEASNKRLMR